MCKPPQHMWPTSFPCVKKEYIIIYVLLINVIVNYPSISLIIFRYSPEALFYSITNTFFPCTPGLRACLAIYGKVMTLNNFIFEGSDNETLLDEFVNTTYVQRVLRDSQIHFGGRNKTCVHIYMTFKPSITFYVS